MVITLLEGDEDLWISDVCSPKEMTGELSTGEVGGKRGGWGWPKPSLAWRYFGYCVLFLDFFCHHAGDRITTIKEDVQKSGVSRRHSGCVSVGESRMDVQGGLEQGEPLGNHLGKTAKNPLDLSTAQKQHEEVRSKEVCQKRRQNPRGKCGGNHKMNSRLFSCRRTQSVRRLYKCSNCTESFKWKSSLTYDEHIHTRERSFKF